MKQPNWQQLTAIAEHRQSNLSSLDGRFVRLLMIVCIILTIYEYIRCAVCGVVPVFVCEFNSAISSTVNAGC